MGKKAKKLGRGTNCRCQCGCTIWVPALRNSDICRWCEGYMVFGKWIEPKHTGSPETEMKGGLSPHRDRRSKCSKCRVPIKFTHGKLIHVVGYYVPDQHEAVI